MKNILIMVGSIVGMRISNIITKIIISLKILIKILIFYQNFIKKKKEREGISVLRRKGNLGKEGNKAYTGIEMPRCEGAVKLERVFKVGFEDKHPLSHVGFRPTLIISLSSVFTKAEPSLSWKRPFFLLSIKNLSHVLILLRCNILKKKTRDRGDQWPKGCTSS